MRIIQDQAGLITVLTAIILPIILLTGALVLESGKLYVRHSQIEHLSRQAGQSGLLLLSQRFQEQANTNYEATCNVESPPAKCSSQDPFDFLNQSEIETLLITSTTEVVQNAQRFALQADPEGTLTETDVTIIFPYLYSPGDTEVQILTEISVIPDRLFQKLLTQTSTIDYPALNYLPLQ